MRDSTLFKVHSTSPDKSELNLEDYFISTGFIDLLPIAYRIANDLNYGVDEIIEAICKVRDKFKQYPPTINRNAWFEKVFREKLDEARADMLLHRVAQRYR